MPRLLSFLLGLLGFAILFVVLFVSVTAFTGPRWASEAAITGLSAPVSIALDEAVPARIEAQSEADFFSALGYTHAVRHPWALALWRQTATGGLSRWFAQTDALVLDLHTRQLGFARNARAAFAALPEADRAALEAYAAGVNAAFTANRLDRDDAFVLLDTNIEPWQPWHSLAVEQLLAYLATPALPAPEALRAQTGLDAGPELTFFLDSDRHLRRYLRLEGFEHAAAVVAPDTSGAVLLARYPYGDSALPFIEAVEAAIGGQAMTLATVPGTLAMPAGFAPDRGWAMLPSGIASLTAESGEPPAPTFDRVVLRDGREELVEALTTRGALYIGRAEPPAGAPPPPPDTLDVEDAPEPDETDEETDEAVAAPPSGGWWVLRWEGFEAGSDLAAWRALLSGTEPEAFVLWPGNGLILSGGSSTVLGSPAVSESFSGGAVVGGEHAAFLAERLALPDSLRPPLERFGEDALSPWAFRLAPPLAAALGDPDSLDTGLRRAAAYLQSWDQRYDADAIGGTLFEAWMLHHRAAFGRLPEPDPALYGRESRTDTVQIPFAVHVAELIREAREAGEPQPALRDTLETYPERADSLVGVPRTRLEDTPPLAAIKRSLQIAVAQLDSTVGSGGAAWRWDRTHRLALRYPAQPDTARGIPRPLRPIRVAPNGHATALAWGPSPFLDGIEPTAAWTGWGQPATGRTFVRPAVPPPGLGRLDPNPEPVPTIVLSQQTERARSVTLVPRR